MPAERAFIGLGANLGDARGTLAQAAKAIAAIPGTTLVAQSATYRSAPVDAQGPDFLNAVLEIRTTLEPQTLLQALQAIEQAHGRLRPYRNAPRTLDLDLLLYGERVLHTPALTVPHPRAHQRAFVLQPLAEIDTGLVIPGHGPVIGLLAAVADQPVRKLE